MSVGEIDGDVVGDVLGDVVGDVLGDVVGADIGDVVGGDVGGDVDGDDGDGAGVVIGVNSCSGQNCGSILQSSEPLYISCASDDKIKDVNVTISGENFIFQDAVN
jgi:uncharacterized protein YcfJ